MTEERNAYEGGCTCGAIRYRVETKPLFVHCCHCHWCQRETGTSYVLNAMIETDRVTLLLGNPKMFLTPSNSGKDQKIWRCPECLIALWGNYSSVGDKVHFVRVGTLDEANRLPPDMHIFTASKQPWGEIPQGHSPLPQYRPVEIHARSWGSSVPSRFRSLSSVAVYR